MNSVIVEFEHAGFAKTHTKKEIKDFLNKVLENRKIENSTFSVSFIEEDYMHKLNMQYRGIDSSTDILSFAVQDGEDNFILPSKVKKNLGDILISPDVLKKNAEYFCVSEEEELKRLLIHGVLHLSGFDHKTNDPSEPMLVLQEEILKALTEI